MKKIIILSISLIAAFVQSQNFKLTPQGFVSADDETKDYVVLEFPEKSKEDIYKASMVFLNSQFNSPKDVLSVVENESITINAISAERIRRTSLHSFKNKYTITLEFKDGKMKIDAPSFTLTNYYNGKLQKLHLYHAGLSLGGENLSIYYKNGEVKKAKAVTDLNTFANNQVAQIKNIFNAKSKDW